LMELVKQPAAPGSHSASKNARRPTHDDAGERNERNHGDDRSNVWTKQ